MKNDTFIVENAHKNTIFADASAVDIMSDPKWFVASVKSCQERRIAEKFSLLGIETYVPTQKVKRKWSDRIKIIDRLLLPGMVFVRCEEQQLDTTYEMAYGVRYYLMDRTADSRRHLAVPDHQMDDFMRAVRDYNGEGDLEFTREQIEKGDIVRVIRGPLAGRIFECVEVRGLHKLIIRVGMIGALLVEIPASDVVKEG